jgi:ribonuclease HI
MISYKLEFECTNNTIEYEALIQGLIKSIDLKVKSIKVPVFQKSLYNR